MKIRASIAFLFLFVLAKAQPHLELQPNGFNPVTVEIPSTPNDKLIELTKNWAMEYNRSERERYDITGETANTLTVTSFKKNAFYYRDRGEAYSHRIKYEMVFTFNQSSYTLDFRVTEIYAERDVLLEYKLPDYFTPEGTIKDGYTGLKTSIEANVNKIALSHYNFIINFR
ncbi:hypothetical protein [Flavobacterium sp. MK4S-17]|uniref:hypothetical protein n=1 Tax=Flavobacterium sp. MK4S-17 TaxID=2543737 RepID=UPI00135B0C32|nr:hypothetical protein [Flavobacterium sp. MK4S-17]